MTSTWHILRVAPGFEVKAASECGAPAYVPRVLIRRFDRRKRVVVSWTAPMIPGYVFVKTDTPRSLRLPPRSAYRGFMRNGDRSFAVLTGRAFRTLVETEREARAKVAGDDAVKPVAPVSFKVGERVRIGMLEAIVSKLEGDQVIAALVGNSIRMIAPVAKVRAA